MKAYLKRYTDFLNSIGYSIPHSTVDDFLSMSIDKNNYPAYLFKVIEKVTGITRKELISNTRERRIVEARWIGIYLIRINLFESLHDIGRLFNRDHSTILYAINNVENLIEQDKIFRRKYETIRNEVSLTFQK